MVNQRLKRVLKTDRIDGIMPARYTMKEFLIRQFPNVAEVLIDPEAANLRAIHVYQKVGFEVLGEFIPSYSPQPHLMMRLNMKKLMRLSGNPAV